MPDHLGADQATGPLWRPEKPREGKALSPPEIAALHQQADLCAPRQREVRRRPCGAGSAQPRRPLADRAGRNLRHSRRGRAGSSAEREDVQPGQAAFLDQPQRIVEHRFGLGRETGDQVGTEDDLRPRRAHRLAEGDSVVAQVPALHPLEDQVVPGLQREVQMRHQPRLCRDRLDETRVGLDQIDRRQPQTRQVRNTGQYTRHQVAEARRAAQIGAPTRQVDAGQHHLVQPTVAQPRHLRHDGRGRYAARIAAAVGDDAEGATVVAAVLYLHIGARPRAEAVDQRRLGARLGHDVPDLDAAPYAAG